MGFLPCPIFQSSPPTQFPLITAIGMCHFLPVHHFGMACLTGSKVNIYIPSFDKNIFSVQATTENGAKVEFRPSVATLNTQGTTSKIHKKGKLYYLNICSPKKSNAFARRLA